MKDKYVTEDLKEEKKEREETNEEEGVDLEQLQGVLKSELDDAQDFIDAIGEDRAEATKYYMGDEPQILVPQKGSGKHSGNRCEQSTVCALG